jgi:hypothetical protein
MFYLTSFESYSDESEQAYLVLCFLLLFLLLRLTSDGLVSTSDEIVYTAFVVLIVIENLTLCSFNNLTVSISNVFLCNKEIPADTKDRENKCNLRLYLLVTKKNNRNTYS